MRNQFLGFANQIIAQHTQGGGPFDSAAMIFPEAAEQAAGETVQNSYVTNLYRIQRITEDYGGKLSVSAEFSTAESAL